MALELRAAVAVTTLKIEPGGKVPCMARLRNGLEGCLISLLKSLSIVFGLKRGLLAMATISPVHGSITIIAPRFVPSVFSAWA